MSQDGALIVLGGDGEPTLFDRRHRDFLLLTIFVLANQYKFDEAADLAEGLMSFAEDDKDALFAGAVLDFARGHLMRCRERLNTLDELAPIIPAPKGFAAQRNRARLYLRARCAYDLNLTDEADAAIAQYLRAPGFDQDEKF